MNAPYVAPLLQRTLVAVYRFYDAFFYPIDDFTPPIDTALDVSVPALGWRAFAADDATYRFSASTLTRPLPSTTGQLVQVTAARGDYVSFEQIKLPPPPTKPPTRAKFLNPTPLWPTVAVRPPSGETAVRGTITGLTAQSLPNVKVEMWLGGGPPPGTPYTFSNANGDFLFRFPLLKGTPGQTVPANIRVADGAIAVTPAALPITLSVTQILPFKQT